MKTKFGLLFLITASIIACDKVEKPYIPIASSELNQALYPGDWSSYPWPTFTNNTNANRNVLLEDYTGHTCVFCPAAADIAHQIEDANSDRVFVATIHAGPSPTGMVGFQQLEPPTFVHDFTNAQTKIYGSFFFNGYGFDANPRGTINRATFDGVMFQGAANWSSLTNNMLTENSLKINLQSKVNYYEETRGLFVHTEAELLESLPNNIGIVTYFIENSFVAPQKKAGAGTVLDYNHHNVFRGCIDGLAWGRTLTDDVKDLNGKYYLNYSYAIPSSYDPANCHLLVYAYDKVTYEIFQVIKVPIIE